jgi:hypothetical protein
MLKDDGNNEFSLDQAINIATKATKLIDRLGVRDLRPESTYNEGDQDSTSDVDSKKRRFDFQKLGIGLVPSEVKLTDEIRLYTHKKKNDVLRQQLSELNNTLAKLLKNYDLPALFKQTEQLASQRIKEQERHESNDALAIVTKMEQIKLT